MLKPTAVLIHVPDVQAGLSWYKRAFPQAVETYLSEYDFTVLDIDGFAIEIVQSDDKVSSGKQGVVLYWHIIDLTKALEHFYGLGCSLYRGVKPIENGQAMCQVEDPFGNLIGLRGKVT